MKKTVSLFIIFLVLLACAAVPVAAQDDHGKNGNDDGVKSVTSVETSRDQVKGDDCGSGQTQCTVTPADKDNQSEVKSGNREDNGINGRSNAENASRGPVEHQAVPRRTERIGKQDVPGPCRMDKE